MKKQNKPAKSKNDDESILEEARKRFKQAMDAESEQRDLELDDINFRNNDQWHEEDRKQRENEGRPCLTVNKLEQRIDQVTGDQRMNRMGALIRPTKSAQSYGKMTLADVYSGIIKNIEAISNAKQAYDTAFDHAVGHGRGYWRIVTEYNDDDSFDQDIKVKRISNSMRVYLDPGAEEVTKKDMKWGFVSRMVPKDDYPDADWDFGKGDDYQCWHEDDKVRIVEYFRRVIEKKILWIIDGKVICVKDSKTDIRDEMTADGVVPTKTREVDGWKVEWFELSANEIFNKKDFPSKYIPIIPCYGKELNVRGKVFYRGVIRYAKDPQRIYNYTRSASIEQVALAPKAPWVVEENQLGNHKDMWENANTKNFSALIYKHKAGVPAPMRQAPPQPSAGWISESQISDQDIDAASGMYKASLGAPSNERSGKAINARKVEGDVGTYHFHDNRALSLQHSYEIMVDMIPRVYDSERFVRIKKFDATTTKENDEEVQINRVVIDNQTNQPVKVYDLSAGKYEVVVDVGASYTTQRQMASESMMELIQYAPQLAGQIIDLIAKNLDWPGADEIAERLADKRPDQQQMQQIIGEAVAKALNSEKVEIDKFRAKTDRIKAVGGILNDGDKIEVELLKILDENDITDEEVRGRAVQIVQQMGEEFNAMNSDVEGKLQPQQQQMPPQQGGQMQ